MRFPLTCWRPWVVVAVSILAVVVAGCSDDDAEQDATPTTTSGPDSTATSEPTTTQGQDDSPTTTGQGT